MSDKNNIEDFFNNSLDGFDESPSDQVWKGLSARMETDRPFWKKAIFRWFGIGGLLLLMTFGTYRHFVLQEINSLTKEKETLLADNGRLERELTACNTISEKNTNSQNTKTIQQLATSEVIADITVQNKNKRNNFEDIKNTSIKTTPSNSNVHTQENNKNNRSKNMLNHSSAVEKTTKLKANSSEKELSRKITKNENYSKSEANTKVIPSTDSKKTEESKKIKVNDSYAKKVTIPPLPTTINSKWSISNKIVKNLENILRQNLTKKYIIEPVDNKSFNPAFRFGIAANSFTTFTDIDSEIELGNRASFIFEFQLFDNFALVSELGFKHVAYKMNFNSQNQMLANSFPHADKFDQPISTIEVSNLMIDLPVGLKWNFGKWGNGKNSFYLNPGVSWQMLLPQQFDYKSVSGQSIDISDERYFLYFGSVFLNAGIERQFRSKMRWQLGLWAENGLVDYGLENRDLLNLGIRGAILFGR